MEITRGQEYKIKGNSKYLKNKYGTGNPVIRIEGTDEDVFGKSWGGMTGNPAAMLYGMRSGLEGLPFGGKTYYGKIGRLGELVHETELEIINPR